MHAHYDAEVDAFYVGFIAYGPGTVDHTRRIDGGRAVDFDILSRPVGVEVLFASGGFSLEGLPNPDLVRATAEFFGLPVLEQMPPAD